MLLQYYTFLRPGRAGYTAVQSAARDVAVYLSGELARLGPFELWSDGADIPVLAWRLKDPGATGWGLAHLSDRLRAHGWLVPAYPLPDDLPGVTLQRIVVRNGMGRNLARDLLADIRASIAYLEQLDPASGLPRPNAGFHH